MNDYVRATRKSDNRLTLINLMSSSGAMNPEISQVDIVQDGDLNKSLQHYVSVASYILQWLDRFLYLFRLFSVSIFSAAA